MNERIVDLLKLCMEVQAQGHEVHFEKTRACVNLWVFISDDESMELKQRFFICINTSDVEETFSEAEDYLSKLIENQF